jgi:hypothetical protein
MNPSSHTDAPTPPAPPESLVNALADKYVVERPIGAGGMATVYLARDLRHDREVALKVLRPELAAVIGADRFLNEVRITARLEHPHIATLIDSGESGGYLWYVLPYIRGESLRDRLRAEGQLGIEESLGITRQVAGALDYAHRQGVVHRDIKPENIMIHEGEALLVDFGIALAVKEAGGNRLTETGLSLGTPQYMSPEQATGDRALDARSDVYSLAAVLYEMLAGEAPHAAPTAQATIAKLLTERPTRLRVVRDTVPEGVDLAVAKALSKVPADRFPTAGDFSRALAAGFEKREDVAANGASRRPAWVMPLVALAVVAAVGVAGWLALRGESSRALVPPQATQVTTTGNAHAPSLSLDGQRLAYASRDCDDSGACSMSIVVQDVGGAGSATLLRGMMMIWSTWWTDDGRFVVFGGQSASGTWGIYSVPSLGGDARFLGCCEAQYVGGDTLLLNAGNPQDSVSVVRWISVADARVYSELVTHHPSRMAPLFAQLSDEHLILQRWHEGTASLMVTDRSGRIVDSVSLVRQFSLRPMVDRQRRLLVSPVPRPGQSTFDLVVHRIGRDGKFISRRDTVMREFPGISGSLSRSGIMAYSAGPSSYEVWLVDRDRAGQAQRRLAGATAPVGAVIDRQGTRVAISRATVAGSPMRQIAIRDLATGAERPIGPPLELPGSEWAVDGSVLLVRVSIAGDSAEIRSFDPNSGSSRVLRKMMRRQTAWIETLAGGGYITTNGTRDSVYLFDAGWRGDTVFTFPQRWMTAGMPSASPDGRELLMATWDEGGDSVTFVRQSLVDGRVALVAKMWGDGWRRPAWLPGGSMILPVIESGGVTAFYTLGRNGQPVRLGPAPRQFANFSWSRDGKRVVANALEQNPDVFLIRNFPQMLGDR